MDTLIDLYYSDGRPAKFVTLFDGSKELIVHEPIPLQNASTVPTNEVNKSGFIITLADGSSVKFFGLHPKDRDEWVKELNYTSNNLSEKTMVSSKNTIMDIICFKHLINNCLYKGLESCSDSSQKTKRPNSFNVLQRWNCICWYIRIFI